MILNLTEEQIDEIWNKLDDEDYEDNGIPNKDINLPEKESMTEREQMLFVINHLKQQIDLLYNIVDENLYYWFESRPVNEDFIIEKYLLSGEYNHWTFE